jgi:hypothetical protein
MDHGGRYKVIDTTDMIGQPSGRSEEKTIGPAGIERQHKASTRVARLRVPNDQAT